MESNKFLYSKIIGLWGNKRNVYLNTPKKMKLTSVFHFIQMLLHIFHVLP